MSKDNGNDGNDDDKKNKDKKGKKNSGVGKGRPPKKNQFGQKGGNKPNKKGRPKGSKNKGKTIKEFLSMTPKELAALNKPETTLRELNLVTLMQKALSDKEFRAIKETIKLDRDFHPEFYLNMDVEDPYKEIERLKGELKKALAKKAFGGGVLVVPATANYADFVEEALAIREEMLGLDGNISPEYIKKADERLRAHCRTPKPPEITGDADDKPEDKKDDKKEDK